MWYDLNDSYKGWVDISLDVAAKSSGQIVRSKPDTKPILFKSNLRSYSLIGTIDKISEEGCKIELVSCQFATETTPYMHRQYNYNESDFQDHPDTDLAIMRSPKNFPLFKDIRKFFSTLNDLEQPMSDEGVLILVPTRSRKYFETRAIDIHGCLNIIHAAVPDGTIVETRDVFMYDHSAAGACGSVAMVNNHTRPLRSLHTAG